MALLTPYSLESSEGAASPPLAHLPSSSTLPVPVPRTTPLPLISVPSYKFLHPALPPAQPLSCQPQPPSQSRGPPLLSAAGRAPAELLGQRRGAPTTIHCPTLSNPAEPWDKCSVKDQWAAGTSFPSGPASSHLVGCSGATESQASSPGTHPIWSHLKIPAAAVVGVHCKSRASRHPLGRAPADTALWLPSLRARDPARAAGPAPGAASVSRDLQSDTSTLTGTHTKGIWTRIRRCATPPCSPLPEGKILQTF